jgi:molybdate-binding protein/DNA-binding XRE family transcriptional regulator
MAEIDTSLGKLRRKRGLSAVHLAERVGVSRQTIYAMEAGTYVPNTAVALRLARALETTVEDLFTLADCAEPELVSQEATLLPGSATAETGQAVQLCQVDKLLVATAPNPIPWYLPAADAIVSSKPDRQGRTGIQTFQQHSDFSNRILVAGCDPGISVLSRHVQAAGIELVLAHRNSSQSLLLLKQGCVHIAGTHLRDESSGECNLPEIGTLFTKGSVAAITFAVWEEGIVIARGNPKSIRGVEDLIREDVAIVNREKGAGSRVLLDSRLKLLGIKRSQVRGYEALAPGHLQAAWQVHSGTVDCCVATRAAARMFGLDFVPLATGRYDLVIHQRHLDLPRMQNLFDTLSRADFRRQLEGFGGYDTSAAGQRVL